MSAQTLKEIQFKLNYNASKIGGYESVNPTQYIYSMNAKINALCICMRNFNQV